MSRRYWYTYSVVVCALLFSQAPCLGKILLSNQTSQPIYVTYYTPSGSRGEQPIIEIPARNKTTPGIAHIEPPAKQIFIPTASLVVGTHHKESLRGKKTLSLDSVTSAATIGEETPQHIIFNTLGSHDIGATVEERSSNITLVNTTDQTVYCALYYTNGTHARRWGTVIELSPKNRRTLFRPERKCKNGLAGACIAYYDRNIYLASTEEALKPELPHKSLSSFNVGSIKGSVFYIYEDNAMLKGTSEVVRHAQVARNRLQEILSQDAEKVKARYSAMKYQGKGESATVREGTQLSAQEQAYLNLRHKNHTRPACQKLFNTSFTNSSKTPTIAVCVSGGGCRAMLAMAGFIAEAERRDFLPLVSYIATLSGSTWYLAAWLASQLRAVPYEKQLVKQLDPGINKSVTITHLQEALLKKNGFEESTTIIDLYGNLIANSLLKPYAPNDNPNFLFWAEKLQPRVISAEVPFPIFTAVTPRQFSDLDLSKEHPSNYYTWVTFDPFEVNVEEHKKSIPAWSFGRVFENGIAADTRPPQNIGFCMGFFGSAMSINYADAVRVGLGTASPEMSEALVNLLVKNDSISLLTQQRASPAKVPNFIKNGMMTLLDAGVSLILPFPPLTQKERNVDIIIAVDASAAIPGAPGLLRVEKYYKQRNLPFPKIDTAKLDKPFSIFWNKDNPQAPLIIYIPLIGGPDYQNNWQPDEHFWTNSIHFSYTPEQAALLSGCGSYMFSRAYDDIMQTIEEWITAQTQ